MHDSCILWHIWTYYPFTAIKDKCEVVGSLPLHNVNSLFYNKGMAYACNKKSLIYPKYCYADRDDHTKMTALLPVCSEQLRIVGHS